ncbi:nucleoside deaminase [Pseudalkalibacillus sp. R45]|uniref:nucleoside deaminase n=1 Tax=Pseudalkalibacillus sp. R45 TaxID=3457433 RepID=UPI003FCE52E3
MFACGRNRVHSEMDATAHAEIDVIRKAREAMIKTSNERQFTLYTTVEPCVMCSGAIYLANIKRVVWALDDNNFGGFRELRQHSRYEARLKKIRTTSMPFDDMANLQRDRMIRWDLRRGKQNHWPEVVIQ